MPVAYAAGRGVAGVKVLNLNSKIPNNLKYTET